MASGRGSYARQKLAKVAIAKTNTVQVDVEGIAGDTISKLSSLSQGLGVTYDVNNNLVDNDIRADVDELQAVVALPVAYCCYGVSPALVLTTTFQKVTGWAELITPLNVTEVSGTFTATIGGIYEWHLERIYQNSEKSPVGITTLYIEVQKNGVTVFSRTAPIQSATANDEPMVSAFNSPFILEVTAGDYFEFYVKADDDGGNPSDTQLIQMQITADKIHNTPA